MGKQSVQAAFSQLITSMYSERSCDLIFFLNLQLLCNCFKFSSSLFQAIGRLFDGVSVWRHFWMNLVVYRGLWTYSCMNRAVFNFYNYISLSLNNLLCLNKGSVCALYGLLYIIRIAFFWATFAVVWCVRSFPVLLFHIGYGFVSKLNIKI